MRSDIALEFVNAHFHNYLINSCIFHETNILNGSNSKAQWTKRVPFERIRWMMWDQMIKWEWICNEILGWSFWNVVYVPNVAPRRGKKKIALKICIRKMSRLNYHRKFWCVSYSHTSKIVRNAGKYRYYARIH